MKNRRFFSAGEITNNRITINGDEWHHLHHVLRGKVGDPVDVFDGRGRFIQGIIHKMGKSWAEVQVLQITQEDPFNPQIILAPSLIKAQAMQEMVEKLSEMGVDEIRPLTCARTEIKASGSSLKKWQKIAIQSLKVNRRTWQTAIHPVVSLRKLIAGSCTIPTRIFLDIAGEKKRIQPQSSPVIAVIGPPGDLTDQEKTFLRLAGFQGVKINDAILRTETAALSVAAILKND